MFSPRLMTVNFPNRVPGGMCIACTSLMYDELELGHLLGHELGGAMLVAFILSFCCVASEALAAAC